VISDDKIAAYTKQMRNVGRGDVADLIERLASERNASAADARRWYDLVALDMKIIQSAANVLVAVHEHRRELLGDFEAMTKPEGP
jgi:hypothetical protein